MAIVRVAAAVVLRPDGTVLLAQRPEGKAYAGYWEFPGGKLEPGESPRQALVRELHEELGLAVVDAAPWFIQCFVYPHAHVELNFFRVFAWSGEPTGHDGQAFRWQVPGSFDVAPLLPANTRVLRALLLPTIYPHRTTATGRPSAPPPGALCRTAEDLARAAALGLDFAVLGPVLPSAAEPGVPALGWDGFATAVAGAELPVFAQGGLDRGMLAQAISCGAHGVALPAGAW